MSNFLAPELCTILNGHNLIILVMSAFGNKQISIKAVIIIIEHVVSEKHLFMTNVHSLHNRTQHSQILSIHLLNLCQLFGFSAPLCGGPVGKSLSNPCIFGTPAISPGSRRVAGKKKKKAHYLIKTK